MAQSLKGPLTLVGSELKHIGVLATAKDALVHACGMLQGLRSIALSPLWSSTPVIAFWR
jgi:hypothetical protein